MKSWEADPSYLETAAAPYSPVRPDYCMVSPDLCEVFTTIVNLPPVAVAGPDQVIECESDGAMVTFNGSGSTDPDGDSLTFTWSGPFGEVTGATVTQRIPVGVHQIALRVDDAADENGKADTG